LLRQESEAQFPGHVNAPVQDGPGLRTFAVYLHAYQLLPCERVSECLGDLCGWRPSPGTISNILESAGAKAAPVAALLKEQIRDARYIHLDETSLNLGGVRKYWPYTASTENQTYFSCTPTGAGKPWRSSGS
jgi:transposase